MRRKREELFNLNFRVILSHFMAIIYYVCRFFSIKKNRIVFSTHEGAGGYMCNPKYIAEELLFQKKDYELIWLTDDISRTFPKQVRVIKNSLVNRAIYLSTAKIWIDNSRKQLEVRKRKGQVYIQTWHAKIGFKPTGLDRGKSFSRIARIISEHDSQMIDYLLSNCDMFDRIAPTGLLYNGKIERTGSPRLDHLAKKEDIDVKGKKKAIGINEEEGVVIWLPTFRGGSQSSKRVISRGNVGALDIDRILEAFEQIDHRKWNMIIKLHPQLSLQGLRSEIENDRVIDVSKEDDLYEILMACDAVITDYSSVAFDAAVVGIPVFLFCYDHEEYEKERGNLIWNLDELPFPYAYNNDSLVNSIIEFSEDDYQDEVRKLLKRINMVEDGMASKRVVSLIDRICN